MSKLTIFLDSKILEHGFVSSSRDAHTIICVSNEHLSAKQYCSAQIAYVKDDMAVAGEIVEYWSEDQCSVFLGLELFGSPELA